MSTAVEVEQPRPKPVERRASEPPRLAHAPKEGSNPLVGLCGTPLRGTVSGAPKCVVCLDLLFGGR